MTAERIKRQETKAINFNLAAYILWGAVLVFHQYFRILTASGIYIVLCIVTILALWSYE